MSPEPAQISGSDVTEDALEERTEAEEEEPTQDAEAVSDVERDYDYLLSMKIWSLTNERVKFLKEQI